MLRAAGGLPLLTRPWWDVTGSGSSDRPFSFWDIKIARSQNLKGRLRFRCHPVGAAAVTVANTCHSRCHTFWRLPLNSQWLLSGVGGVIGGHRPPVLVGRTASFGGTKGLPLRCNAQRRQLSGSGLLQGGDVAPQKRPLLGGPANADILTVFGRYCGYDLHTANRRADYPRSDDNVLRSEPFHPNCINCREARGLPRRKIARHR
jgi:hypothetical protein